MVEQAHGQLATAQNATGSTNFRPDSRPPIGSETHARLSTESHNELLEKVVITNDIVIAWPIRLYGVPVLEPETNDSPLKLAEQPTTDVTDPATNCKLSMSVRMKGVTGQQNLNVHTRVHFRGSSPEYNFTVQNAIGPVTFNGSDRVGTETTELQISVSPSPNDQHGNQWKITSGVLRSTGEDGTQPDREQFRANYAGLPTDGQENDPMGPITNSAITPILRTDDKTFGNQKQLAEGESVLCAENPQHLIESTQLIPDGTCIKVDTLVSAIPNETTVMKLDQVESATTDADHEVVLQPQAESGPETRQELSSKIPTELGEETILKTEISETSENTGAMAENIIPSILQTTELNPAQQKERTDEIASAPTTVKDAQQAQLLIGESQLSADAAILSIKTLSDVEPVVTNEPEVQHSLGEKSDRVDLLNSENVVNIGDEAQDFSPTREERVTDARTPKNGPAIAWLENVTQPDTIKMSHLTSSSHRSDEVDELDQKYKNTAKALAKEIIDKVKLKALEHEIPSKEKLTSLDSMSEPKVPQQLSEQSILSPQSDLSESKQEDTSAKASSREEVVPSGLVSENIPHQTESSVKSERVLPPSDSALQYAEADEKQNYLTQAVDDEDQEESEWSHSMYHYRHYHRHYHSGERVRPNDPSSPGRTTRNQADCSYTGRHLHHGPRAKHGRSHTLPRSTNQVCDCQHCMANKLCEVVRTAERNGIEENTDEPNSGSPNSETSEIHKVTMALLNTLATTAELLRNQYRRRKINTSRTARKQAHLTPSATDEQNQRVREVADPEMVDASVTARNMSCAMPCVFTEPRKRSQTTARSCHRYCCSGHKSHILSTRKTVRKKVTETSKGSTQFGERLASFKHDYSELKNNKRELAAPRQSISKIATRSSRDSARAFCTDLNFHDLPYLRYINTAEEVVEAELPEADITIQQRTERSAAPVLLLQQQQRKASKNRRSQMKTDMNTN